MRTFYSKGHLMKVYLVGGAVRDAQLGLPIKDRDWVVVGATPELMLQKGFKPVGKDFPVFLHPITHEEYALARQERKTGKGYHGFAMVAVPEITLEQDLLRRDLRINAMAQDEQGNIIDPYDGLADLKNKRLRHVSDAFKEDPVRVLRLARFYARFYDFGFTIADETQALITDMIECGELDHLTPERIWIEITKGLSGHHPDQFINALRSIGALRIILPEVDALFDISHNPDCQSKIDCGSHTLLALQTAAKLGADLPTRFACLCRDLGKVTICAEHIGHNEQDASLVAQVSDRLKVPSEFKELAIKVARYHKYFAQIKTLEAHTILVLLLALDVLRKPTILVQFNLAYLTDKHSQPSHTEFLSQCFQAIKDLDVKKILSDTNKNNTEKVKQIIHESRINAIKNVIKNYAWT